FGRLALPMLYWPVAREVPALALFAVGQRRLAVLASQGGGPARAGIVRSAGFRRPVRALTGVRRRLDIARRRGVAHPTQSYADGRASPRRARVCNAPPRRRRPARAAAGCRPSGRARRGAARAGPVPAAASPRLPRSRGWPRPEAAGTPPAGGFSGVRPLPILVE